VCYNKVQLGENTMAKATREITISPSKLSTFVMCPQQFALEYLQEERPAREQNIPMAFGTFMHSVFEMCIKDPSSDVYEALADLFITTFGRKAYGDVIQLSGAYEEACERTRSYGNSIGKTYKSPAMTSHFKFRYGDALGEMYREAFGLAEVNLYQFWSDAQVCAKNFEGWFDKLKSNGAYELLSEAKFDVLLPFKKKGIQFRFNGVIDLVILQGDEIIVVDFKTNQTVYAEYKSDFSLQLAMYCQVIQQVYKKTPKVAFYQARLNKYKVKTYDEEKLALIEGSISSLLGSMVDFILAYEKEGKSLEGKSTAFYLKYADRFPLMSASVQGCPCRFIEQCAVYRPLSG